MNEAGFMELILIAVILLLVVGPERLPRVARFAGVWYGKAMRSFESVKEEVNKAVAAQELKDALKRQSGSEDLYDIVEETKKDIQALSKEAGETLKESRQAHGERNPNQAADERKPDDRS